MIIILPNIYVHRISKSLYWLKLPLNGVDKYFIGKLQLLKFLWNHLNCCCIRFFPIGQDDYRMTGKWIKYRKWWMYLRQTHFLLIFCRSIDGWLWNWTYLVWLYAPVRLNIWTIYCFLSCRFTGETAESFQSETQTLTGKKLCTLIWLFISLFIL